MAKNRQIKTTRIFSVFITHYHQSRRRLTIENIQKRALRYITKDYSSTYTELRNMACKPLLCVYRIKLIIIEIFKIIHKIGPSYLLFARKVDIHNFKCSFRATKPKFRTIQYGKHCLRYEGAQM